MPKLGREPAPPRVPRIAGPAAGPRRPPAPRRAPDTRLAAVPPAGLTLAEGPSPERLRGLFARSGLRLSPVQVQQFWAFHQLLRLRNDELDLTRLHSFDTIVLKHYVDCAIVATLVDLPSPLLDLGSGAGFPGIPLKIVRPDVHLILGEPRAKRVEFLNEVVRELGLHDVEVVAHRVSARFDYPVRGVITRAVETIPATLARVAPWMEAGSRVFFMKGPGTDEELATAKREWAGTFRVVRDVPYTIPETPHERRLVVLERLQAAVEDQAEAFVESDSDPARWDDDDIVVVSESGARRPLGDKSTPQARAPRTDTARAPQTAAAPVVPPAPVAPSVPVAPPAPAPRDGSGREHREILSATNDTFKLLRGLLDSRGIRKSGQALIAGARPVLEILRECPERARAWVTAGTASPPPAGTAAQVAWYRLAPPLFQELDTFGTGSPLLLVDVPPLPAWEDADWPVGCTMFVPFQDPENVGAVIRTAAALGVPRVVLLQEAANPFHPRAARAAGSALLRVEMQRGPALRDFAPVAAPVLALSPEGRDLGTVEFPAVFGLLLGVEGPGLPAEWRERAVGIPMQPGHDSLNAAAAAAIALYLWSRSRAS